LTACCASTVRSSGSSLFDDDAQQAERGAAQRERVLGAGGRLVDAEDADQRVELVGQRHGSAPVLVFGRLSPANVGMYCSFSASATSSGFAVVQA
jgi:hypothetical protein